MKFSKQQEFRYSVITHTTSRSKLDKNSKISNRVFSTLRRIAEFFLSHSNHDSKGLIYQSTNSNDYLWHLILREKQKDKKNSQQAVGMESRNARKQKNINLFFENFRIVAKHETHKPMLKLRVDKHGYFFLIVSCFVAFLDRTLPVLKHLLNCVKVIFH